MNYIHVKYRSGPEGKISRQNQIFFAMPKTLLCLLYSVMIPGGSVLTNLLRGRVRAFGSCIQKYNLWQKSWVKDTQKYELGIFQCSTFLYGRHHGPGNCLF